MSLRQEQSLFTVDLVSLIRWLYEEGYEVSIGEVQRTTEQQAAYVRAGRSQTMNSMHLYKCAADLFIFKNGVLLSSKADLQFAGNKWESMSAANTWGGNWNSFKDTPHFQRTIK
jgi:peptidoglycan L-alanyl-D-glutamate endopeptidase CwlK